MSNGANLILINDSASVDGGATKLAVESALSAASAGWRVRYLTQKIDHPDPRLAEAGVTIVPVAGARLSNDGWGHGIRSALWNSHALKAVRSEIENSDLENTVIHLHNWAHFMSPSIFSALAPVSKRVIMTAHDFFHSCGNGGQYNYHHEHVCHHVGNSRKCIFSACDKQSQLHKFWRLARHQARLGAMSPKKFQGVLAPVHPGQAPYFARAGFAEGSIRVVRNPVTAITQERVPAEDKKNILFIGRLSHEKGATTAARLAEKIGAKLVFCGDGPLQNTLKANHAGAEFRGFCSANQLAEEMRQARLVLMPSRTESFGLVAVESIWSGVPVVINETSLIAPEIAASNAGLSLDLYDSENAATRLTQLMRDNNAIKTMSENGFNRCRDIANTPNEWREAQLKIYRSLLGA